MLGGVALRQMDVYTFKIRCVRGHLGVRLRDGGVHGVVLMGLFGTDAGLRCLKGGRNYTFFTTLLAFYHIMLRFLCGS